MLWKNRLKTFNIAFHNIFFWSSRRLKWFMSRCCCCLGGHLLVFIGFSVNKRGLLTNDIKPSTCVIIKMVRWQVDIWLGECKVVKSRLTFLFDTLFLVFFNVGMKIEKSGFILEHTADPVTIIFQGSPFGGRKNYISQRLNRWQTFEQKRNVTFLGYKT